MKTFIINLERSAERRKRIVSQAEALGLEYELFAATDGSLLSEKELGELCDLEATSKNPRLYNRGMLGASISHYRVYEKMLEEGLDQALILEDDVNLEPELPEIVAKLENETKQGEIIMLHYMSFTPLQLSSHDRMEVSDQYSLYYPVDFAKVNSAAGYIVTREAATMLTEALSPIRLGPDSWADFYRIGGFQQIRFVHPMPVNPAGFKSTIAITSQSRIRGKLTQFVDDFRIPVLYQLLKRYRVTSIESRTSVEIIESRSPYVS